MAKTSNRVVTSVPTGASSAASSAVLKAVANSTKSTTPSSSSSSSSASSASQAAKNAVTTASTNKSTSTSSSSSSPKKASTSASQAAKNAVAQATQNVAAKPVATASGSGASSAAIRAVNDAVKANETKMAILTQSTLPTEQQTAQPQVSPSGYVGLGTYEDAGIRANGDSSYIDLQKQRYAEMQQQYLAAKAKGDEQAAGYYYSKMQEAHSNAEAYRAQYGYRGGIDGSQYLPADQNTPPDGWNNAFDKVENDPNYIDGVYVHPADQSILSQKDLQIAIALKKEWPTATPERRKEINQEMESMRARYGYSLGPEGDQFKAIQLEPDTLPQMGLPSYEFNPEMVNNVYDQLNNANLQQLLASYNNSRAQSEYDMSKIPAMYQQQKNLVSADNEREKMAFREQAAASGLNAGNRSQAALAYSNQLQNSLGQLNTAEANALADAQFSLTQLYNNYQQQIATAVAQNNYERAAALLQEYMKAKESAVDTALSQANLDIQIADFNRTTRLNNLSQQNLMREYNLNLANSLADIGSYNNLAQLGGMSNTDANTLRRWFAIEKLGESYPLLRNLY